MGYHFVGKFRLSRKRRNFPPAKLRGVGRAVKTPMALHSAGAEVLGKCSERQILSDVVD